MKSIAEGFKNLKIRQKKQSSVIGVLAGGISSEREISIKTGKNIFDSLKRSGYSVRFIDLKDNGSIDEIKKIDIAFLALHGKYGEDGTVQGLLELLKIPYTGSGILSSALVMDKILSKKIMIMENIPTPDYIEIDLSSSGITDRLDTDIRKIVSYPVVVKPNAEGSTIGISRIKSASRLIEGIKKAALYDRRILIEKYIDGRELTVGIIGMNPVALPVIEIRPRSGFFDYEAKYTKNMTEYIIPPEMKTSLYKEIQETSLICHKMFSCCGLSRVDFILDSNNTPYVLEVNTMPGMTSTSLVPMAAGEADIEFDHLIEIILDSADLKVR
ncbi:MAG TPA: D-alanine--D-alanine ligase [Actinobacteria bacterium]|nr:D-alanine--D-alanine ligase [Actinomycetota bacterium]